MWKIFPNLNCSLAAQKWALPIKNEEIYRKEVKLKSEEDERTQKRDKDINVGRGMELV